MVGKIDHLKKYYSEKSSILGWGENSAKLDTERAKLLKKFIQGKKVLDIGCGFGVYVNFICSLNIDGYGVDLVDKFVAYSKKYHKGRFFQGSAEKLPFKNDSFDTVILFDILEHGDDIKILREAKRVAKKRILIIVPREIDRELREVGVIFRHYLDKSHLREYQENSLSVLAKKLSLKLVHLEQIHPLNNKIIFISLFKGPTLLRDIIRKIVDCILPRRIYFTEFFSVFEKS